MPGSVQQRQSGRQLPCKACIPQARQPATQQREAAFKATPASSDEPLKGFLNLKKALHLAPFDTALCNCRPLKQLRSLMRGLCNGPHCCKLDVLVTEVAPALPTGTCNMSEGSYVLRLSTALCGDK